MQACVEVWESDPAAYHYNPVGYIALGAAGQEADLVASLRAPGADRLPLELIIGEAEVDALHEGAVPRLARTRASPSACTSTRAASPSTRTRSLGLAGKCESEGVAILSGVEVTAFEFGPTTSVTAVETNQGRIEVGEQVVVAPGPWAKHFWRCSSCLRQIDVRTPSGDVVRDRPMWTYWNLQEGEITVDPLMFATADGGAPPVIHLDTDAPLVHGRRQARHRRALGHLLQARPPRRPGRRLAARRRRTTSSSTPTRPPPTSIPTSRTCGAPRSRTR